MPDTLNLALAKMKIYLQSIFGDGFLDFELNILAVSFTSEKAVFFLVLGMLVIKRCLLGRYFVLFRRYNGKFHIFCRDPTNIIAFAEVRDGENIYSIISRIRSLNGFSFFRRAS